jgi:hypothetical protein
MSKPKITTVDGLSVDLSRIKAIKINTNAKLGPTNVLTVDLNLRFEYVFDPNENKHIKESIEDTVSIAYVGYNEAVEARETLTQEWQEYLDKL